MTYVTEKNINFFFFFLVTKMLESELIWEEITRATSCLLVTQFVLLFQIHKLVFSYHLMSSFERITQDQYRLTLQMGNWDTQRNKVDLQLL